MEKLEQETRLTPIISVHRAQEPGLPDAFIAFCACDWWYSNPECHMAVLELIAHLSDESLHQERELG